MGWRRGGWGYEGVVEVCGGRGVEVGWKYGYECDGGVVDVGLRCGGVVV